MEDFKDILDICKLNKLKDANADCCLPETEKESNDKAITYKIANLTNKVGLSFSEDQIKQIKKNQKDYDKWVDALPTPEKIVEE